MKYGVFQQIHPHKERQENRAFMQNLNMDKERPPVALAASLAKLLLGKSFNTRAGKQVQLLESSQPLPAIHSAREFEVT